ncbi:MAG TPA: gliding motility lipoprotein GldH, partial [Cyclobacteriaceae bacterium]|nr:gliding motility lipoprotein GldH [Cyclobacteriaceae bacterium]
MRLFIVFISVAALLSSCDNSRVFEDNKDFSKRAWTLGDTVAFEFSIPEPTANYNLLCNIRNTLDYPYSRIFVNYTLEDSTHRVLVTKLVSDYLFDVKTGEPHGNSGIGDIYDHRFSLESRKLTAGKYFVKLQQYMRTDTLQGVLAAGVRVEKIGA